MFTRSMWSPLLLVGMPIATAAGCGGDVETTTDVTAGGQGAEDSHAGAAGQDVSEGGTGGTNEIPCDAGGSPSADEACRWDDLGEFSCTDARCLDEGSVCADGHVVALCDASFEETRQLLDPAVELLGNFCADGHAVILRAAGGCEQPVLYRFSDASDGGLGTFEISFHRALLAPDQPNPEFELVCEGEWTAPPDSRPYLMGRWAPKVNPSETRALFYAEDGGSPAKEFLFEMDLTSGTIRALPARGTGDAVWLDDSRFLQVAYRLGFHGVDGEWEAGLYLVDTRDSELSHTVVVRGFEPNREFEVIDDHVVMGAIGLNSDRHVLAALPLSAIHDVAAGERSPIDLFADPDVHLVEREGVSELQGFMVGGRWLISYADETWSRMAIESLTVEDGQLLVGPKKPFIAQASLLGYAEYAGADRLLLFANTGIHLVRAP